MSLYDKLFLTNFIPKFFSPFLYQILYHQILYHSKNNFETLPNPNTFYGPGLTRDFKLTKPIKSSFLCELQTLLNLCSYTYLLLIGRHNKHHVTT